MRIAVLVSIALFIAGCSSAVGTPSAAPSATVSENATETDAATTTQTEERIKNNDAASEESETVETAGIDHAQMLDQLLFGSAFLEPEEVLADIRESGDTRFVAGLIDTLRYQRTLGRDLGATLNDLTGQDLPADWFAWVEWAGQHPEIESFADYPAWKSNLFSQIDPMFQRFVYADIKVDPDSRVEEIVWGGVRVDGIPALDNPQMVDPQEATYLEADERVFGVSLNGDTRAYPARFLDWHEMFNDIVGGEPVSLAY